VVEIARLVRDVPQTGAAAVRASHQQRQRHQQL